MIEEILRDLAQAEGSWRIAVLLDISTRSAPTTAASSKDPNGIPNNLMPYISQVCRREKGIPSCLGNDYETARTALVYGTIYTWLIIAKGHMAALRKLKGAAGHRYPTI